MRIPAPFAYPADLAARWRTLTPAEENLAETLLGDASQMILDECPEANFVLDDDLEGQDARSSTLMRLVCGMVKRSLIGGEVSPGFSTRQETAGPFSESVTFANPMGDLYLTKAERNALPCSSQTAFMINVGAPVATEGVPPWWVTL